MVGSLTNFREKALSNYAVIMNLHHFLVILKTYEDTFPVETIRMLVVEGGKCQLPMGNIRSLANECRLPTWCFSEGTNTAKLDLLKTPMGESMVYDQTKKKKCPKKKGSSVPGVPEEDIQLQITSGSVEREKTFLDDVVFTIDAVYDSVPTGSHKPTTEGISGVNSILYSMALEFC